MEFQDGSGVRADGTKELVALSDGFREFAESWADLLRDCKRRGIRAPVLAVGDGALGFWRAIRDVFPETAEQRCWWHKIGNVPAALPKSAHPGARRALAEICNAEDEDHAIAAAKAFNAGYGTKWPKAVAKVIDDLDVLLTRRNGRRRSLSAPGIIAARRPVAAVCFGAIVALRVGITEALSPVFRLGRLEMPWPSSRRAGTMPCA
jgi:hypothetical protein